MSLLLALATTTAVASAGSPFCADTTPSFSVSLSSENEDQLAHWYMGTLGFKSVHTVYGESGDTIHVLSCGALALTVGPAGDRAVPLDTSGKGISGFGWTVSDFDAALKHLRDNKVAIEFGPTTDPFGQRMLMLKDPDGNSFEITDPATPFGAVSR